MTGPNWKLEDDYKTVTLTIPTTPVETQVQFDLAAIEDMLANLGEFRAAMQPEVPRSYPLGQKVAAVPDPIWSTEPELLAANSLLHIRNPRFGWLHYLIPKHEAKKLGEYLLAQVETSASAAPSDKTN